MFCKHKWKILSETKTESSAQRYANLTGKVPSPRFSDDLDKMVKQKLIQIITCTECGKLKRWETKI
jgi:hypothetical protein